MLNVVHGHIANYTLTLEVTSNKLGTDEEDHKDWVGNYSLLPDLVHRGIPTYQNTQTGKLLVFDGTEYYQKVEDTLQITPTHPHDSRGK